MRQQKLSGYLLHQRPYREKRAIYQFFTLDFGVVHGVGARGLPLFTPLSLLATGKNSLKSFSHMSLGFEGDFDDALKSLGVSSSFGLSPMKGRAQYALLYSNEILYKLLPAENPCPVLWRAYHTYLVKLHKLDDQVGSGLIDEYQAMQQMKLYLRAFELVLFNELGVLPDFLTDSTGDLVDAKMHYRFIPEMGFIQDGRLMAMLERGEIQSGFRMPAQSYRGADLLAIAQAITDEQQADFGALLAPLGRLSRQLIDHLLEYRPLHSRTLWQQSIRYH